MGRPKTLQSVLVTDQLPMWAEAKIDPQPFPLAMLRRLCILMDQALAGGDVAEIKKVSDMLRDWYRECLPAVKDVPKGHDVWEDLKDAFTAAESGYTRPA